jgi:hypothetical protein
MAGTKTEDEITPEILRDFLHYDPETGVLTWKPRSAKWFTSTKYRTAQGCANNWNARHAGKPAFTCVGTHGYYEGRVFKRHLLAHRAAYAIIEGVWPPHQIDHIDGCRSNNRWDNLRPCTRTENARNVTPYGSSGFLGVYKSTHPGSYTAKVQVNGVSHYVGGGRDPEALARLRDKKAKELHGKFARLNFPNE